MVNLGEFAPHSFQFRSSISIIQILKCPLVIQQQQSLVVVNLLLLNLSVLSYMQLLSFSCHISKIRELYKKTHHEFKNTSRLHVQNLLKRKDRLGGYIVIII